MAQKNLIESNPSIVIAVNNASKMGFVRRLVNLRIRIHAGTTSPIQVFSVKSPKRAMKVINHRTAMLVVDYQFSNKAGTWKAYKVVKRARKLNKDVAVVVLTKPKDKRLYDKEQPFAYLALGNSPKRKRKFQREFNKQLDDCFAKLVEGNLDE